MKRTVKRGASVGFARLLTPLIGLSSSSVVVRSLLTSRMSATTLYKGIAMDAEDTTTSATASRVQRLGDTYAVKSGAHVDATPESDDIAKRDRSFSSVCRVIDVMTSGRPNRCPNNIMLTKRLVDRLHLQPVLDRLRFVHIAGTKGKGTTAAYTAALLQAYGFKVGLFTSPHLTDVRERILVDNALLSPDRFADYFFRFKDRVDALTASESQLDRDIASRANFFRFMFLLSLYIFDMENVEVAVMEVGLGGRIDATNVVPSDVSIVTALGYDHMDILGTTLREITLEKAGILKPGVVCFASPQRDHPETRAVLQDAAKTAGASLLLLDDQVFPIRSWPPLAIGGAHAVEDSKLGLMAARHIAGIPPVGPLDEVEREVLRRMTFSGRSQVVPMGPAVDVTFYLDGAHTPESIYHAMTWFVQASEAHTMDPNPRRVLLFYTSRDPGHVLKAFMPFAPKLCKVIVAQVKNPRVKPDAAPVASDGGQENNELASDGVRRAREDMVATTERWRNLYREIPCLPCARPFDHLEDVIDLVLPAASETEDAAKPAQVFVVGSFYLLSDMMRLLKNFTTGVRRES